MKVLPSIFFLIIFCNILLCFADSERVQTSNGESIPIEVQLKNNSMNNTTYFYAYLNAGTPEDTYPVLISLNSVNSSLFTDICDEASDPVGKCLTEKKFPVSSSTCHYDAKDGAILNGNKSIIGYVGTETIGFTEKTRFTTDVVFRVNSTMDYNLSGLVSLSPRSSFLELLYKNKKIDEQVFMYKANNKTLKDLSSFIIGTIPPEVENITWIGIGNSTKWQVQAFYLAVDGVKVQDCQERSRNGFALFNESRNIQLTIETLSKLITNIKTHEKNIDNMFFYSCDLVDLEKYPVITIYTENYSINITADVYLDFQASRKLSDNKHYCPLAIDIADASSASESCISLGYNYFIYNQVLFSKTRNQIGLSGKQNLKNVKIITGDSSRISGLVGLFGLALAFGFVYLRFSHKEDELKKQINTTPGDLNSYSFYEYSEMDT